MSNWSMDFQPLTIALDLANFFWHLNPKYTGIFTFELWNLLVLCEKSKSYLLLPKYVWTSLAVLVVQADWKSTLHTTLWWMLLIVMLHSRLEIMFITELLSIRIFTFNALEQLTYYALILQTHVDLILMTMKLLNPLCLKIRCMRLSIDLKKTSQAARNLRSQQLTFPFSLAINRHHTSKMNNSNLACNLFRQIKSILGLNMLR